MWSSAFSKTWLLATINICVTVSKVSEGIQSSYEGFSLVCYHVSRACFQVNQAVLLMGEIKPRAIIAVNIYNKVRNVTTERTFQGSGVVLWKKIKEHFLDLHECKCLTCAHWFPPSHFVPSCQKVLIFSLFQNKCTVISLALKQMCKRTTGSICTNSLCFSHSKPDRCNWADWHIFTGCLCL